MTGITLYKGWRIYQDPNDQLYRANKFGVKMRDKSLDSIKSRIDQRELTLRAQSSVTFIRKN